MSKGLEALKKIKWKLEDEGILGEEYELCDIIEKELQALEIIKEKKIELGLLKISDSLQDYEFMVDNCYSKILTQEEYELLKEVLL